ncbi:MAG: hypothetical protein DHS20C19_12550 [Acidimicrobiales bacterium]|nr:MAG: hypothetical protein DHS20C19_12550 [Acidimicrobiales bacterium]
MSDAVAETSAAIREREILRSDASWAARRAEDARVLARDIGRRRRLLVTRDDAAVARHTADVWSSRAASRSREELQRAVGFSLWAASDGLRETELALEARARELDRDAQHLQRAADAVVIGPVIVLMPTEVQAATVPTSNPVPRGNR